MNNKQIIQEFRLAIADVKGANRKTIRISALENFLAEIESVIDAKGEISETDFRTRLAEFHAQRDIAEYNAHVSSDLEMFRSVISTCQIAIRNITIINGGACVAILAFVSNLFEKNETLARSLAIALIYFGSGVLSGGLVAGGAYLTQNAYNAGHMKWGLFFKIVSIILGIAAYVCFALGGYEVYCSIR